MSSLDVLDEQIVNITTIIHDYFDPYLDSVPETRCRLNTLLGYLDALKLMSDQMMVDRDAAHRIANKALLVYIEQVHAVYIRFPEQKGIP